MILSNRYDNPKICKRNADLLCVISISSHCYCGWGVYCIDCSHVSYVRLINQCGLHVNKIKIFYKKISGCGLYSGALNRLKITVVICAATVR